MPRSMRYLLNPVLPAFVALDFISIQLPYSLVAPSACIE